MGKIISKLNLNKTPNLVEPNSLVFAKNIRADKDGTLHKDYSIFPHSYDYNQGEFTIHKDLFYRIYSDFKKSYDENNPTSNQTYIKTLLEQIINDSSVENRYYKYNIVGIIPSTIEYYLLFYIEVLDKGYYLYSRSFVIRFIEKEERYEICPCNWKWSGGEISGTVDYNLRHQTILNIAEFFENDEKIIPIKHINLSISNFNDDESIYTQMPNIPITNLNHIGNFVHSIPNGVYQFFVRYKIKKNHYTNWFPASKELFVGNSSIIHTTFGSVQHINLHKDSDSSFILGIEHLNQSYKKNYESFQIGFIVSHDNVTLARAWKEFDFNVEKVYFNYNGDGEEIEITDLFQPGFQIYNVGNLTSFRNKLYISNYTETDFNKDLQSYANKVVVAPSYIGGISSYNDLTYNTSTVGTGTSSKNVITSFNLPNNAIKDIHGNNGIVDSLLNKTSEHFTISFKTGLNDEFNRTTFDSNIVSGIFEDYGIKCTYEFEGNSIGKDRLVNSLQQQYASVEYNNNTLGDIKRIVISSDTNSHNVLYDSLYDEELNIDNIKQQIINNIISINDGGILGIDENEIKLVDNNGKLLEHFDILIYRELQYNVTPKPSTGGNANPGQNGVGGNIIGGNGSLVPPPNGGLPTVHNRQSINLENNELYAGSQLYYQTISVSFSVDPNLFNENAIDNLQSYTTLLPKQQYQFYIHYVSKTGEITNGYKVDSSIINRALESYKNDKFDNAANICYPIFSNITYPNNFVACFFSIVHTKNQISHIVNLKYAEDNNANIIEGTSLDFNTRNIPYKFNNKVQQRTIHTVGDFHYSLWSNYLANYYDSSDASFPRYFGSGGIIRIENNLSNSFQINRAAYIVNDFKQYLDENVELIKCTPFIKNKVYNDYTQLNLLGYLCKVKLLDRNYQLNYYTDTDTIFKKKIDSDELKLEEFKEEQVDGDTPYLGLLGQGVGETVNVYSNYNYNYLQLNEDPVLKLITYYTRVDDIRSAVQKLLYLFPSLTSSELYVLPAMYKNYLRKTYSVYSKDKEIKFDNTVRCSTINQDEENFNIYRFDPEDYYNISTNRGIITNLIAIGNGILVHTKDSIFKFEGNNNLQSEQGNVQQVESDPFTVGATEVFGSEFGFAGLQNRKNYIITENGYIFFDSDSKAIYVYSGSGQITKISDNIEKLLRKSNIVDVQFANDYHNNRFFVSVFFEDNTIANLSFNFQETIKGFISLHDFCFTKAFNTKNKCYFITNATNVNDICEIYKDSFGCYPLLDFNDNLYPKKYTSQYKYVIKGEGLETEENNIQLCINEYNSIIDIIDNTEYELIKTLNSVIWCSRFIAQEFSNVDSNSYSTLKMAEDLLETHSCASMRIYTDTCITPLIEFNNIISNDLSIRNPDNYKYPHYNQGKWTLNYFRNIENTQDTFNYLSKYNDGRQNASYRSDNNSLIEGKYFVVRFIFTNEFKLETLNLSYNYKL